MKMPKILKSHKPATPLTNHTILRNAIIGIQYITIQRHLITTLILPTYSCDKILVSTIMSIKISFISNLPELELLGEHCKDLMPYLQLISTFKQQSHNVHLNSLYQFKRKVSSNENCKTNESFF